MGNRKHANSAASSSGHSYLSTKTDFKFHGRSLESSHSEVSLQENARFKTSPNYEPGRSLSESEQPPTKNNCFFCIDDKCVELKSDGLFIMGAF
uniref:Uncharacterized protein n=1 Tax=Romanomermis culicivorax TaxID=13658 RepID=A0A915J2K1_ROMCU